MRFWLLDSIEEFSPGERLAAVKNVSYSEEYLQDHFPNFPVLPGVFMLEAATQAGAWLLRLSAEAAGETPPSVITLHQAKNIKYADFVKPGQQLRVEVKLIKQEDHLATFKVSGAIGDKVSLSGRLVLKSESLANRDPSLEETDTRLRGYFEKWRGAIVSPSVMAAAV